MKASELRIGNWVNYENEPIDFILDDFMNIEFGELSECYEPIPLTEEWLLNFGFNPNPYEDRYELGDIDIECDKTKGVTELWLSGLPHIKYLHQLQNLYHALTGKELTIK